MDPKARFSWLERPQVRAGLAAAVGIVLIAGVVAIAPRGTQAPPSASATETATASAGPTASLANGSSATPGSPAPSTPGTWTAYDAPAFVPAVDLQADSSDAAGVAQGSTFTLRAAGLDAASLARTFEVSPVSAFTVSAGPDASTAVLRPTDPLAKGQTYRFTLHDATGAELGRWAFPVQQSLHVDNTLPGDQETDVPLNTGIEVRFDHDGATGVPGHISISPAVDGTVEAHGRTFVFVPKALKAQTVYTVTVHRGIGVAGSTQTLEHDVAFSFETGVPDGTVPDVSLSAETAVLEASPGEKAIVALSQYVPDQAKPIRSVNVQVHRLATEARALAALRAIDGAPDWAHFASGGPVETKGLPRAVSFTAHLSDFGDDTLSSWFQIPVGLPRGWYVITIARPGIDIQIFLQVSSIATYTATTSTRTVVWTNSTSTHRALTGATVSLAGGSSLGRTDARGLLDSATPKALLAWLSGAQAGPIPVFVVRARGGTGVAFSVASGSAGEHYLTDARGGIPRPEDRYVSLLYTDRSVYRQSDTVDIWGLVRDRTRSSVPAGVKIRIFNSSGGGGNPPIAVRTLTPSSNGAFSLSIPIAQLPFGGYTAVLGVGSLELASAFFQVDVIRKPAYLIDVATDLHAVIAGDPLLITSHLAFYDGTGVPDTAISVSDGYDDNVNATTGASGTVVVKMPARTSEVEGYSGLSMNVTPAGPAEGEIYGSSSLVVFQSSLWLAGKLTLSGGRLVLDGTVHDVDLAALEKHGPEIAATGDIGGYDFLGRTRPGVGVDADIVELVPVRKFAGQHYDFLTKRVIDTYTYTIDEHSLGTRHVTAGSAGKIHFNIPVAHPNHAYRVTLHSADAKHRVVRLTLDAETVAALATSPDLRPYLTGVVSCVYGPSGKVAYAVGDTVTTTMSNGRGPLPSGGDNQYLFLTAQGGLRDLKLQATPRLSLPFTARDVPNLSILGVRFDGDSYAPVDQTLMARFDPSARALTIRLTPDAASYRPGGLVTLRVETVDAGGHPVPATVTLRAVDEKLFTIGAANEVDPLADLYVGVPDGLLGSHSSRQDLLPRSNDGCGAGGGGGDGRDDFRDTLLFQTVNTDATGHAVVTFKASDDLTSWHVSASAVTKSLQAGEGSTSVHVGLPFFVDANLAPEYLASDKPAVRVRAFGDALKTGDPVMFTVSSSTLPMVATNVRSTAFTDVDVALPALTPGDQSVTITATSGTGATARSDTLIRHFRVISSRLETTRTSFTELVAGAAPSHGDGLTTYVFSDAGRGKFLAALQALSDSSGARLDQALSSAVARDLLARWFPGALADGAGGASFDSGRYESPLDAGLALLPYGGSDLVLSADAALVGAVGVDEFFTNVMQDPSTTRERRIIALAGLAALGEGSFDDVRAAAAATDLEPTEELYLGLAAAALGDASTARRMEAALLGKFGQRQGPWVRLTVGTHPDDIVRATAQLAMLAAEIGDPVGDAAYAFVLAHPATENVTSLFEMGYVAAAIGHASAAPAKFAYTVDGTRRVVDLAAGQSFELALLGGQAAGLSLEPISGRVGVTTAWQAPATLATSPIDPAVTIARTQTPAGDVPASGIVTVTIKVDFAGLLGQDECYEVTDLAPSGFVPTGHLQNTSLVPQDDNPGPDVIDPYEIDGQVVRFCAIPLKGSSSATLRYYLRVVTTGAYTWEPAVAQSSQAANGLARTEPTTIVVH